MNTYIKDSWCEEDGTIFIYNAATSTTHAVTKHATIFKTMLSYKRLHIITTPATCTKQSPTGQLGPTLSLARG